MSKFSGLFKGEKGLTARACRIAKSRARIPRKVMVSWKAVLVM